MPLLGTRVNRGRLLLRACNKSCMSADVIIRFRYGGGNWRLVKALRVFAWRLTRGAVSLSDTLVIRLMTYFANTFSRFILGFSV
jgi:hypothetical protein